MNVNHHRQAMRPVTPRIRQWCKDVQEQAILAARPSWLCTLTTELGCLEDMSRKEPVRLRGSPAQSAHWRSGIRDAEKFVHGTRPSPNHDAAFRDSSWTIAGSCGWCCAHCDYAESCCDKQESDPNFAALVLRCLDVLHGWLLQKRHFQLITRWELRRRCCGPLWFSKAQAEEGD